MDNRISFSFVDFLDRIKYYLIIGAVVILLAVSGVLIYMYNAQAYDEKAIMLLEATNTDYEALLKELQKSKEESVEVDVSDEQKNKPTQESVLAALREVVKTYPKSFAAQKAQVQLGIVFLNTKKYKEAHDVFLKAATRRRKTYLTPIAYLHAAITQENIDASSDGIKKAQEYYQNIVDTYPQSIVTAQAYFSLGRLAEQSKGEDATMRARAQSYYKTLVENDQFRDSQWVSLAQSRLVFLDSQKK